MTDQLDIYKRNIYIDVSVPILCWQSVTEPNMQESRRNYTKLDLTFKSAGGTGHCWTYCLRTGRGGGTRHY